MGNISNFVGFAVSVAGALVTARAFNKWQGVLREGIFFFLCGFFLLALGFVWGAMYPAGTSQSNGDLAFFATGVIFAFFGTNKLFVFKKSQ